MALKCDYCGEEIEGQAVKKGARVYCCDDRPDSTVAKPIAEPIEKREE